MTISKSDRSKSLQELEGSDWGEPAFDSHLVTAVHRLRRKPLQDFTVEDLRLVIGQQVGLPYLVPLAIECLESNSLIEGDMYPGDLLVSVCRIEDSFWSTYPADLRRRLDEIVGRARMVSEVNELLPWAFQAVSRIGFSSTNMEPSFARIVRGN